MGSASNGDFTGWLLNALILALYFIIARHWPWNSGNMRTSMFAAFHASEQEGNSKQKRSKHKESLGKYLKKLIQRITKVVCTGIAWVAGICILLFVSLVIVAGFYRLADDVTGFILSSEKKRDFSEQVLSLIRECATRLLSFLEGYLGTSFASAQFTSDSPRACLSEPSAAVLLTASAI